MNVLEQFICGKENNPDTCEDGLVIGEKLVAVIDGVTAKGTHLWGGKKSGCYAKDLLIEYLKQDIAKQPCIELIKSLDQILKQEIDSTLSYEEYPRANVIIYNDLYKEIWVYGDCQCRINDEIHTHSKKIDEMNSDLRAFYLEYELFQGKDIKNLEENDLGRKAIQKNLLMQFAFENKKSFFGYPVLNGMGIEESMIKVYPVSCADEVVLASDGYPVLRRTLEEAEKELYRVLKDDPMCFRLYRSTKGRNPNNVSFDDRVFCRFVV